MRPPISLHHIFQLLNDTSIYLRVRKKNEIEGKKRDAKRERIKGKICEFGICVVIRDTSNGDESEGKGREGRKKKRKENRKLTLFPVSKRIRSIRRETKSIDIRNSTSTSTLKAEM